MIPNTPSPSTIPPIQLAAFEAAVADHGESRRYAPDPWRCPICGDECVHLIGSGALQRDTITIVAGDGIHQIRGVDLPARGSTIITVVRCESDHTVALTSRAERGRVYRGLHHLEIGGPLPTLWRD